MQSSCAHYVPHYTAQALRAQLLRTLGLRYILFALLALCRFPGRGVLCARRVPRAEDFPKRAHKRAFSRLVRSFSKIADTVLSKVEKHECIFFWQACSRLTSRFRVASYCRRVDLECDKHGVGGGSMHCDDNDAQPDA